MKKSLHSICRWTFNPGKGGFVPGDIRPEWDKENFDTVKMIQLVRDNIADRMPDHVQLGIEMHYDTEVDERNASEIADTLIDTKQYLALITPGAHSHFAYGGISSLDPNERKMADEFGQRTVDLAYGPLRKAWHPAMLIPTVASALIFWRKLEEEFGIPRNKKGVNKEFGHSEMIGLDHVYDTVEELDNDAMVHMHLNSQGYNDGIILGGPGKYDIDHGVRINGMNIAIASLLQQAGYNRWRGHDMQTRAYDNTQQGIDRVIRSILSWEACEQSARALDCDQLMKFLANRETAKAEDLMRAAVVEAQLAFNEMYKG